MCSSKGEQGFSPYTETSRGGRRRRGSGGGGKHFIFLPLRFLIQPLFLPVKTNNKPTPAPYRSPFACPFPVHPSCCDVPRTQESRRLPHQHLQGCELGRSPFPRCSSCSLSLPFLSPFFLPPPQARGPSQLGVSWGGQANLLDTPGYYPVYHRLYAENGPKPILWLCFAPNKKG